MDKKEIAGVGEEEEEELSEEEQAKLIEDQFSALYQKDPAL
jgi:hypothetical protein